jgi:hypothetical protein
MPDAHFRTTYEGPIYSPFSGQPAEDEEGPNFEDETLQWIYCGDAGSSPHVGSAVLMALGVGDESEASDLGVEVMLKAAKKAGCLILEVDMGWNGVNLYGFRPSAAE